MLRKTLRKSLIVGLTVLSTMSFASVTDLQSNVKKTGEKSFALYLNDLSTNVQIVLKDQEGRTLYKEQVKDRENYARNFNLDKLAEGEYTLKIEDGTVIELFSMQIEDKSVVMGEEEITYKPSTTTDDSMVNVEMPSMNGSELNVMIRDNRDELIFKEVVVNKEAGLNRTYDFSKIKSGDYTFIFNTNGYTFIHPVNIRK